AFIVNHDKAAHALAFFLLTFLMHRSFKIMQIQKTMLLTISFGVAIEMIQFFFTPRGFSLEDLIYDIIGVIVYVSVYQSIKTVRLCCPHSLKKS
ncbi:MAG: VanZ family protein, partial [Campylobacterota bacterium]